MPDVIASTANNLKTDGWVSGQTWGYEVVLPQNFDYLLADRSQADDACAHGKALGVRRAGDKPFPHADGPRLICCCRPARAGRLF